MTIEVLSLGNGRHDRVVKMGWYRQYGVREFWIVDPIECTIAVFDLVSQIAGGHTFEGSHIVRSGVLPRLRLRPSALFPK